MIERYQRRTPRLAGCIGAVVRELAGRAGARVLCALAMGVSRHTAVRVLPRMALPAVRVPRVLGVDDFALAKRRRYATILIDAETRERIDVLPDRGADTLEAWLREHPGVQVMLPRRGLVSVSVGSALVGLMWCRRMLLRFGSRVSRQQAPTALE